MNARLAPSEMLALIDTQGWGWDCDRADLTLLVQSGWAGFEPGARNDERRLLLFAPREPEAMPPLCAAFHEALARQAQQGVLPGRDFSAAIKAAIQAAYGGLYSVRAVRPYLAARGLAEFRQVKRAWGLFTQDQFSFTPAGAALVASIDRRLSAASAQLGALLKHDPAQGVAAGCALGTLFIAAYESQKYGRSVYLATLPLAEAARQFSVAPAPPPAFALQPGDEIWAEIGAAPLQPAELVRMVEAMASVAALKLRHARKITNQVYERD